MPTLFEQSGKLPDPMFHPMFQRPEQVYRLEVQPPSDECESSILNLFSSDGETVKLYVGGEDVIFQKRMLSCETEAEREALIKAQIRSIRLRKNRRFSGALVVAWSLALAASLYLSIPYEPALAILFGVTGIFVVFSMKIHESKKANRQNDWKTTSE